MISPIAAMQDPSIFSNSSLFTLTIQSKSPQKGRPANGGIPNSNSKQFIQLPANQHLPFNNINDNSMKLENSEISLLLFNHEQREKSQLKIMALKRECYSVIEHQINHIQNRTIKQLISESNDTLFLKQKEEKSRIDAEEFVVKKYFTIKADETNFKNLVFKLVNSVLQISQATYNQLVFKQFNFESVELLRQTTIFKEQINKLLFEEEQQFRVTSVLFKISQFSRNRLFIEIERLSHALQKVHKIELYQQQRIQFQLSQQHTPNNRRCVSDHVVKDQEANSKTGQSNEMNNSIYSQMFFPSKQRILQQGNEQEETTITKSKDIQRNTWMKQNSQLNQNERTIQPSNSQDHTLTKEQKQIQQISQINTKDTQLQRYSNMYFRSSMSPNKDKRSLSIGVHRNNISNATSQQIKLKLISQSQEKKNNILNRNISSQQAQASIFQKRECQKIDEINYSSFNLNPKLKTSSFVAETNFTEPQNNNNSSNQQQQVPQIFPNFVTSTSSFSRYLKIKAQNKSKRSDQNMQLMALQEEAYTPLSQLIPQLQEFSINNTPQEQLYSQLLFRNQHINQTQQSFTANTQTYHSLISQILRNVISQSSTICQQVQVSHNNFLFLLPNMNQQDSKELSESQFNGQETSPFKEKWVSLPFLSNLKKMLDAPSTKTTRSNRNNKLKLNPNKFQNDGSPLSNSLRRPFKSRDFSPLNYASPITSPHIKESQIEFIPKETPNAIHNINSIPFPMFDCALSKQISQAIPAASSLNQANKIQRSQRISQKVMVPRPLTTRKILSTPLHKLSNIPTSNRDDPQTENKQNNTLKINHINLQTCQSPIQDILKKHAALILSSNDVLNLNNFQDTSLTLTLTSPKINTNGSLISNQTEIPLLPPTTPSTKSQISTQSQLRQTPFWKKFQINLQERMAIKQEQ